MAVVARPAVAAVVVSVTGATLGLATVRSIETERTATECRAGRLATCICPLALSTQGQAALAEVVGTGTGATVVILFAECTLLDTTGAVDARGLDAPVAAVVVAAARATWLVAAFAALAASKSAAFTVVAARFARLVTTACTLLLASGVAVGRQGRT